MAELRELIAERLTGRPGGPYPYPWQERVVETGAADPDLVQPPFGEQPWLLVRNAGVVLDLNRVETLAFEVSVYASNTSFADVDALERLVASILEGATLVDNEPPGPDRAWALRYAGTLLGDQVITAWDAYVRTLRFEATGTGGMNAGADDERAEWFRAHAAQMFRLTSSGAPPCVQTDPLTWTPTDECPGVYARPESGPVEAQRLSGITYFREVLAVHVVCPTQKWREYWVNELALQLPGQMAYFQPNELDSNNIRGRTSTILLRLSGLTPAADPATVGQLRIEVTFSALEAWAPSRYGSFGPPPSWGTPPPGWPPNLPWPPAGWVPGQGATPGWPPNLQWPPPGWNPGWGVTDPGDRWDSILGPSELAAPLRSIWVQPGGPEEDDQQGPWVGQPRGPEAPAPAPPYFGSQGVPSNDSASSNPSLSLGNGRRSPNARGPAPRR